jgi:hypothetical protein
MNRLSPWIARRRPAFVPSIGWTGRMSPPKAAAAAAAAGPLALRGDLELFATTFLGGLVFFGTMIA